MDTLYKSSRITVRIDPYTKSKFEELAKQYQMKPSTLLRLFIKAMVASRVEIHIYSAYNELLND
ncbi:MAG: hypothetical protein QW416_08005 [Candidatus Nitrosocaldaceae archaeon]